MPPETIWSNNGKTGYQSQINGENQVNQQQKVFEEGELEVPPLFGGGRHSQLASLNGYGFGRRVAVNDGRETDKGNPFGLKRGSFSAITAPVGDSGEVTKSYRVTGGNQGFDFGTASISGGVANRHPPQDSFLQKFSSVAETTRELELANNLGAFSIDSGAGSRRTSEVSAFNSVPRSGSVSENRNISVARNPKHQSVSEKIDNYNKTSPLESSATLSKPQDLNDQVAGYGANTSPSIGNGSSNASATLISAKNPSQMPFSFWGPAAMPSFSPAQLQSPNYFFSENGGSTGAAKGTAKQGTMLNPLYGNFSNIPAEAFVPPTNLSQFTEPYLYGMHSPSEDKSADFKGVDEKGRSTAAGDDAGDKAFHFGDTNIKNGPGIGLGDPKGAGANFMFQLPFPPYGVVQQSPVPNASSNSQVFNDPVVLQHVTNYPSPSTVPIMPHPHTRPSPMQPTSVSTNSGKRKGGTRNFGGKSNNHIYRSPLLEEIRSNTEGKEYYLKDIYGHAVEFTRDQHGSRFIQQKLPRASTEEKEVIFNEIRDISYDLMTDVFGNYVIQKYFEYGSPTQMGILLEHMFGHIYDLSLQMYGCRVVQRALESITLECQIKIITELKDNILVCAKDQNGNHVIQKSIEQIPFENVKFIVCALESHIYHLSTHPYGCRVIQRLLEYSTEEDRSKVLNELNKFIFYLIQDQYGNYVIQHTLERGNSSDRAEIMRVVLGSVVSFSKHKFASNVIEKCIKYGDLDQKKKILHEVMLGNEDFNKIEVDDSSPLALMMKDQYANYVIQKLVEGFDAKSDEKRILVIKLRQYLKQISFRNTYGKHLASVEKMIIVAETALIEAERSS